MRARQEREEVVLGYAAPIKRGLWERVKSFGVPYIPGSLWFVVCLFPAFLLMVLVSIKWVLVCGVVWLAGMGVMLWLTALDPYWPDVMLAQLVRRYKSRYEAG